MPAEYKILRAFTGACACIHVPAQQPRGLAVDKLAAVGILADGLVAGGEIRDDGRAAKREGNARRLRSPEILADLRSENQLGHSAALEQQSKPERNALSEKLDIVLALRGGGEMPLLVEFVVVREELLRHNAKYLPVLNYDGAVVKLPAEPQRTAHGNEHVKPCGVLRDILQRDQGAVKQGLLKKQILTGVAGNAQLRQN